jgi:2-succinyl-6-hydroxy-2,4-cyclohexadiene-1-carboxylate synthase
MPDRSGLVLLLHGFSHTGASWEPVLAALRERGEGNRALAPDIRGHGSASEREPVDLAGVMGDLVELMSERCVVAGYSMGGRLALHLALNQPRRVHGLVLIGASPGLEDDAQREARRQSDEALAAEIERSTIEEFAARWAQTPVLAGLPPPMAERAHEDRLRSSPAGLARALRGLGTGALPPLWERLPELRAPVTLVVGERDGKFQGIAHRMTESIPQAEVVVVPGAGHAVHLEAPERVAEIISDAARDDRR